MHINNDHRLELRPRHRRVMARLDECANGEEGTLFKNITFFVLQRVPTRNSIVDQIESNGGKITKVEKNADVVIADHARKDAPPDSLSWKWIEESIKAGNLVDKEEWRAGPAGAVQQRAGALRRPARLGRNTYSKEDDVYAYRFVNHPDRKGMQEMGNKIYQQLAESNDRHPWQSWRDRYLKFVRKKPPPEALEPYDGPLTVPTYSDDEGSAKAQLQNPPSDSSNQHPDQQSRNSEKGVNNSNNQKSTPPLEEQTTSSSAQNAAKPAWIVGQTSFTEKDKDLLLYEAKILIRQGEKMGGVEPWEDIASQMQKGTAEEWAEFFDIHVRPIAKQMFRLSEELLEPLRYEDSSEGSEGTEQDDADAGTNVQEESVPVGDPATSNPQSALSREQGSQMKMNSTPRKTLKRGQDPIVIVPSPSAKRVRFRERENYRLEKPTSQTSTSVRSETQTGSEMGNAPSVESSQAIEHEINEQQGSEGAGDDDTHTQNPRSEEFSIWQGSDQPPEDEKENSPRRTPPSRGRERPFDALNLAEGTLFRLEPAAHFPSNQRHEPQVLKSPSRRSVTTSKEASNMNGETFTERSDDRPSGAHQDIVENPTDDSEPDDFVDAREMNSPYAHRDRQDDQQMRDLPRQVHRDINSTPVPNGSASPKQTSSGRFSSRNAKEMSHETPSPISPSLRRSQRNGNRHPERSSDVRSTQHQLQQSGSLQSLGKNRPQDSAHASTNILLVSSSSSPETSPDSGFQTNSEYEEVMPTYVETQDLYEYEQDESHGRGMMAMVLPPDDSDDGRLFVPSQSSQASQTSPYRNQKQPRPSMTRDTQALLNDDSPALDLNLVASQSSQASGLGLQPSSISSVQQGQASSSQVDRWIDFQVQRGHNYDNVVFALERTSFNSALALDVLGSWNPGEDLPRKPGIFTEEDDRVLMGGNAREMKKLEKLHGEELMDKRFELLSEWDSMASQPREADEP